MQKLRALLVGQCAELMLAMPSLLHRSGFEVDVILINELLKKSKFIANYETALNSENILQKLSEKNLDVYDFIVICDDQTLKNILDSNLTTEQKLKLLPVKSEKDFGHIFSKIGLSKILSESGVTTPPFLVVEGFDQAIKAAEKIGFPLMIKINSSNGGSGVFECEKIADLNSIDRAILNFPLLMQKKIIGTELDLSAIYRDKKLIYFSYSKIEKVIRNKFGPSVIRSYQQLNNIDEKLFLEMEKLGEALGANGFVTISCLESILDGKRYFIEADMRPNTWVEFGRFFGDDPAKKISKWFLNRERTTFPFAANRKFPEKILMPYFLRMSGREILLNRYRVWRYMPWEDFSLLISICVHRFLAIKISERKARLLQKIQNLFGKIKRLPKAVKRLPTTLIRLVIPCKKERAKIRNNIKQQLKKPWILIHALGFKSKINK